MLLTTAIALVLSLVDHSQGQIQITLVNNCGQTVWPGFQGELGNSLADGGGTVLGNGDSTVITVPCGTPSARIWARTKCTGTDGQNFTCETGDCGGGTIQCQGRGGAPPVSLAEFTLGVQPPAPKPSTPDSYDVSYVDGYNVMVIMQPDQGGTGAKCQTIGQCSQDLKTDPDVAAAGLQQQGSPGQPPAAGTIKAMFGMCGIGGHNCCTPTNPAPAPPTPCESLTNGTAPPGFSAANATLYQKLNAVCPTAYLFDFDDTFKSYNCQGPQCGGLSDNYHIYFCSTSAVPNSKK